MGFLYLVSLAFVASIFLIDGHLRSEFTEGDFQPTISTGMSASRLLRSNNAADKKLSEERAGGLSVPALEKVKSVFTSSKAATAKLQSWLKSGKPADAVFIRLHLHGSGNPFYKPQFVDWIKYADELSANAKAPEMSAISILTRQYGDDDLFYMIKRAKMSRDTESLATELETKQLQHWIKTRKDPDEVFHLFHLDVVMRNIVTRPEFGAWSKYVDDLNRGNFQEPTWMYQSLKKYIRDNYLFQMTYAAKRSEETKAIAIKVENDWLQAGLQSGKTPEKALLDLGLGKTSDSRFESFLLNTWANYMEAFSRMYREEKTTMIETLTKGFGDIGVTKMLQIAKTEELTKNLATKLESEQLKMWLNSEKSTDDVFKLLQLDKYDFRYNFRDLPLLSTWVSYLNAFITKNPDTKDSLFLALQSRLRERPLNQILNVANAFPNLKSTATKIQTSKIPNYLERKESPFEVFELLALDDIGDDLLGTPLFQKWMKYVETFNEQNPNRAEYWFTTLLKKRDMNQVGRMIDRALQNPNTANVGKMVEKELRLHTLTNPKFELWVEYVNAFNLKYPDKKTTVIDGLRAFYNERILPMMVKPKNDPLIIERIRTSD